MTYSILPDSAEPFFIANKMNLANLTHIYRRVGVPWSANLMDAIGGWDLHGPTVGDATYFGISTANPNHGPFNSLVFNLTEYSDDSGGVNNLFWEYWNGSAWAGPMGEIDWTDDGTNGPFSNTDVGVLSVHFVPPSNWTTAALNGVTAWWIRLRVGAVAGAYTKIAHQAAAKTVYTVTWPFVEVRGENIGGDIASLAELILANKTYSSTSLTLGYNRVTIGLRDLNRGEEFHAYLNVSDEQQPPYIVADVPGANTVWASLPEAPTGRCAEFSKVGSTVLADEITVTIAKTQVEQFLGRFRVFMRVTLSGVATVYNNLLIGKSGQSSYVEMTNTAFPYYVIDFGEIAIPAGSYTPGDVLGDLVLTLQIGCSAAVASYQVIDIILMPADQAYYNFQPSTDGVFVGEHDVYGWTQLDIDSVRNPKTDIRALLEKQKNSAVVNRWIPKTAVPMMLLPNIGQRLWIMGWFSWSTYPIAANVNIGATVQMRHVQRYTGMRGNR